MFARPDRSYAGSYADEFVMNFVSNRSNWEFDRPQILSYQRRYRATGFGLLTWSGHSHDWPFVISAS